MKNIFISISTIALVAVSLSCGGKGTSAYSSAGDTLHFKYAEHITMVRHDGYTEVSLSNPWKPGAELHRYLLVPRADSARMLNLPQGTVVYTPVQRAVVSTAPHCWLLDELGAANAISGVCDLPYINMMSVHQAVRSGKVVDCGNSMSPSVEHIVSLGAQAILVSPFDGVAYGQLDHIGVPIIECAEYMETSALGRAEWMRFYGALVGREKQADSLFEEVERNYIEWSQLARASKVKPRVITERVVSGTWYCPGGKSSMGKLIADAGGNYVFADDGHSGSLSLSPEKVIDKAANANRWLFVGGGKEMLTPSQLLAEYKGYGLLRAFKEGQVYECLPSMRNPYFEESSFRPDFLLIDFVRIFHPELTSGTAPHYYICIDNRVE